MRYVLIVVLMALMIAGTWFAGWVTVPVLAALFALVRRDLRAPRDAGIAALHAWLFLLLRMTSQPSFNTLLNQLGQIFPVPGAAVAGLSLLLAVVLAASAARVMIGIVGIRHTGERPADVSPTTPI